MLAVVFAFSAVVVAPASAKLTKHQKAHIRKQLKRAIKKNPKLIRSKHFIKKASLVDFVLPVTVKLRSSGPSSGNLTGKNNPNHASIDLGTSLGSRDIYLGGSLPAEIAFHDSYDGGALGNVDLKLLAGGNLTTTSIPLLWNTQVTQTGTHWSNPDEPGCGDFSGSTNLQNVFGELAASSAGALFTAASNTIPANVQSGAPVFASAANAGAFFTSFQTFENALHTYIAAPTLGNQAAAVAAAGGVNFGLVGASAPETAGVDDPSNIKLSDVPGDHNNVGVSPHPFPGAATGTDPTQNPGPAPTYKDVVLRTNALSLSVVAPGTPVNQATALDGDGAQGSQKVVIGQSGGQANLFGKIPGKSYGIDVTVSLQTKINSIIREVDSDNNALVYGGNWPGAAFQCRQAWTGGVQNYLAGIHLTGNLKISPAISGGKLRIAKATLSQQVLNGNRQATRVALAACLMPYSTYAKETGNLKIPGSGLFQPGDAGLFPFPDADLPIDSTQTNGPPASTVKCNDAADALTTGSGVLPLTGGQTPYTTINDGSQVSVAGDLDVKDIEADILIGENQ